MNYAIIMLCAIGLQTELIDQSIIGGNWVQGQSGQVYVAGHWVNGQILPDSATHTNLTISPTLAQDVLAATAEGKSVAISGITDPQAFMDAFGLVRCNENGSELETE